ncbi:hypothetical protein [Actinacidiphila acididurans]|uniref:Uncharacterized protein n=1 Tax=Actinacidiphila acididurans TaxID=2784346 RepID=A0ABS2TLC8_9ACTN|nr:hypothetical protein [Actinacidiphila acididurans]MBM9503306.1 hypothetical protein [Actinacidiphila acididurans]
MQQQSRTLPEQKRRTLESTIRSALPDTAFSPGRAADLGALIATLAQAEQIGHDPRGLLKEAIAMRELDTAQNIEDVLVWRLRRLTDLPAHPETDHRRTTTPQRRAGFPEPPAAPLSPLAEPHRSSSRRR